MTILLSSYYYKPHIGGVENSLYSIASAAMRKGDEAVILVSDSAADKHQRLPGYEQLDGVSVYRFRHFVPIWSFFYFFAPIYDIISCWLLARKLRQKFKFDLVVARHHMVALPLLSLFEEIKYIVPGVVKFQDTLPLKNQNAKTLSGYIKKMYMLYMLVTVQVKIQNKVFNKCKKLYVFSDTMVKQIVASVNKPALVSKIQKVSPGVDMHRFALSKQQVEMELPKEVHADFVFIGIGRLTLHKGFHLAIDAFSLLVKRYPDRNLKLLIVGEGPEHNNLRHQANKKGVSTQVIFPGQTSTPEKYYTIADAFIMSSIYEPFGQTIIEAMASGLPVIAFESGKEVDTATSHIVTNEVYGFLCAFSVEAMASTMEKILLMSTVEREKISQAAKDEILKNYSWERLIERIQQ